MQEIVLINITGPDRPGLTAAFAGILARADVQILDIGQAVIHDTLSFGILVQMQGGFQAVTAVVAGARQHPDLAGMWGQRHG